MGLLRPGNSALPHFADSQSLNLRPIRTFQTVSSPTAALTAVRCLAQEKGRGRLAVVEMIQEWRKELEDLHGRIAHRFARPEPRRRAQELRRDRRPAR